jgi:hypothetical protein
VASNFIPVKNIYSSGNCKEISIGVNIPKTICIYNEGIKGVNLAQLRIFIKKNFGNISVKVIRLKESIVKTQGIIFDLIATNKVFGKISEHDSKSCHIILTDKLFATYNEDRRPHIRAAIYSFPSVISISGVVEGPAKPRDYYIYKNRFTKLGVWEIEESKIKKKFKSRFIDYSDRRITAVLKGLISQAIFFYITGEPFCTKKKCRLFNAHWQEDLIYSQVKIGVFCKDHRTMLKKILDK